MKTMILIVAIIFCSVVYSQKITVNEVLNSALSTENKLQRLNPTNDYKISWHHLYKVKDSMLFIRFTKTDNVTKCACTILRSVSVAKIKSVAKDINVVFLTTPNAVKQITTYQPCITNNNLRTDTIYSDMFFTEIKTQTNNEDLGKRLQESFAKSGLKITVPYWYD